MAATDPRTKWETADLNALAALVTSSSSSLISYTERLTNITITATTTGTANPVLTAPAFTADGVSRYRVEFFTSAAQSGAGGALYIVLYEDGAFRTYLCTITTSAAGATSMAAQKGEFEFVPTAGSRTYSVRAYRLTADGLIVAGTGTGGDNTPAFLRISRA